MKPGTDKWAKNFDKTIDNALTEYGKGKEQALDTYARITEELQENYQTRIDYAKKGKEYPPKTKINYISLFIQLFVFTIIFSLISPFVVDAVKTIENDSNFTDASVTMVSIIPLVFVIGFIMMLIGSFTRYKVEDVEDVEEMEDEENEHEE